MGIKLAPVGCGPFGSVFAPLFTDHPLADSVILCGAEAEKVERRRDHQDRRLRQEEGVIRYE